VDRRLPTLLVVFTALSPEVARGKEPAKVRLIIDRGEPKMAAA
jgi:hypothetical protein